MYTQNESPILTFLMRKENLLPALEIISYAEELRQMVANKFWEKLVREIKKCQPNTIELNFSPKPVLASKTHRRILVGRSSDTNS